MNNYVWKVNIYHGRKVKNIKIISLQVKYGIKTKLYKNNKGKITDSTAPLYSIKMRF